MMNHMKTFMEDFFNYSTNGYINRIIESFETKRDLEIFNIYIYNDVNVQENDIIR
jgi:hypothetical protein